MKKLFIIAAVVALILPSSVFALEQMSDQAMDQITGQAGVSIAVDDVKIYQSIDGLSYTDGDGAITGDAAGTVSLDGLTVMVNINAITSLDATTGLPVSPGHTASLGNYVAGWDYGNYTSASGNFTARALTIDVGTCEALTAGLTNNMGAPLTVAGVVIGLPTLEITQNNLSLDVTVTSAGAANSGASYGTLGIGAQTIAVLDGTLEIAPH